MDVNTVYRTMKFIARKNQLASMPPSEFEFAFNSAQRNYYDFLIGRIEQYRYDSPKPRVGIAMTDNIMSRLTPFIQSQTLSVSSGNITKPVDFNKLLSMYTVNNYPISRIEENRLSKRINDTIDPVSEKNSFYVEGNSLWSIYPSTLTSIKIKYLKVPTNVVWGYNLDDNGRPVYNASTSVNPLWMDNDIDEIIGRALKLFGVSTKENTLIGFGSGVIQNGE